MSTRQAARSLGNNNTVAPAPIGSHTGGATIGGYNVGYSANLSCGGQGLQLNSVEPVFPIHKSDFAADFSP